jgi:hypothetical protein
MVFDAHVVKVLIASPGDTGEARDAVERAVANWNSVHAQRQGTIVLPWRWEKDAVPLFGASAQDVINSQAVDESDVVIALFNSRLGQATADAVSGTAEEIERANKAGKPVHVYFSTADHRNDVDARQLLKLQKYRKQLAKVALLGDYANDDHLMREVDRALNHDVHSLRLGIASGPSQSSGAALRVERDGSYDRVVVRNHGDATAENVTLTASIPGDPAAKFGWMNKRPEGFDVQRDSKRTFVYVNPSGVKEVAFTMDWTEGGQSFSKEQLVDLF